MEVQKAISFHGRFDEAIGALPDKLRVALSGIPESIKNISTEVRLRTGQPIAISCPEKGWFIDSKSQLHTSPSCYPAVSSHDLSQTIISMCSYSVHSHQSELAAGFISLRGGHRAGICGTAVIENGYITALRDITSINIRIARQITGAADSLIKDIFGNGLCGILIAGSPSSGKTTILRDLARQLAGGNIGRYVKVAVIDERCELGAVYEGIPQNNLGATCDILSGYSKGQGILSAVRSLSPEAIICDEIGDQSDAESILCGIGCGVKIIASAHAGSTKELIRRPMIRKLLDHGAFDKIVLLDGSRSPGAIKDVILCSGLSA